MHDYCKLYDSQQLLGMSICVYSLIGVITLNSATVRYRRRQIYAQLPTSADNVALPAFAAAHRAVERRPCSSRSISPARRAHSSKPVTAACGGRQTDRQTDRQTPDSYRDPVRHTMQAASQRRPLCMSHTSQRCRPVLTFFFITAAWTVVGQNIWGRGL